MPADFTTIGAVFGNHQGSLWSVARGGDLWIRYGDGTLKNLTQAAGYGVNGLQGASSIAVREPSVHWSGTKALFSMVVGGADAPVPGRSVLLADLRDHRSRARPRRRSSRKCRTSRPTTTTSARSTAPTSGSSSPPIGRATATAHLYPQLDEYEEAPSVTGLWSLDPGDRRSVPRPALAVRVVLAADRQLRPPGLRALGSPAARPAGRQRRD